MTEFEKKRGHLTVGEALELNRIAEETCGLEATAQIGGEDA
jgi:hypothetical protein